MKKASPGRRVRIARRRRPGAPRASRAGERLRCLVLASRPAECLALDLDSAAFVRLCEMPDAEGRAPSPAVDQGGAEGLTAHDPLQVLEVLIGGEPTPADPVRPERVTLDAPPRALGPARARGARRLLDAVAQEERGGVAILGTRGPSLAYADLEPAAPSLALLRVRARQLELVCQRDGATRLVLSWAGAHLQLPVSEPRAEQAARAAAPRSLRAGALSAALGFEPGYLLVGLDRVEEGHVRKFVLGFLAR